MNTSIQYPWLNETAVLSSNESFCLLNKRRDELLEIYFTSPDIDDALINEWIALQKERDRVFRQFFLDSVKQHFHSLTVKTRNMIQGLLNSSSVATKCNHLPADLKKLLLRCLRRLKNFTDEHQLPDSMEKPINSEETKPIGIDRSTSTSSLIDHVLNEQLEEDEDLMKFLTPSMKKTPKMADQWNISHSSSDLLIHSEDDEDSKTLIMSSSFACDDDLPNSMSSASVYESCSEGLCSSMSSTSTLQSRISCAKFRGGDEKSFSATKNGGAVATLMHSNFKWAGGGGAHFQGFAAGGAASIGAQPMFPFSTLSAPRKIDPIVFDTMNSSVD